MKLSREEALLRVDNRVAQLARLAALGAPQIILDNQRKLVAEAQQMLHDSEEDEGKPA